jgi:branched-chain amino acid transport system permease protein
MAYFLQQVLNGLHGSALYALLAFGYSITHGVLRRTNLAYGPVFAFCGQMAILAAVFGYQALWLTWPLALALGLVVALAYGTLLGILLGRAVYAPLVESSPNTIIAATLGVSIVLMELAQVASDAKDYWLPPILAIPVLFLQRDGFKVTLTVIQLINVTIAIVAILTVSIVLARSRIGRAWRAVCDDPFAAAMCGVNVNGIFLLAVVAGAILAAIAGCLSALYFGNISLDTGLLFGLKILFVAAIGGYRSPIQAALGAAAIGMGESLWTGYLPNAWRDAVVFLFLTVLLVLRPNDDAASARI